MARKFARSASKMMHGSTRRKEDCPGRRAGNRHASEATEARRDASRGKRADIVASSWPAPAERDEGSLFTRQGSAWARVLGKGEAAGSMLCRDGALLGIGVAMLAWMAMFIVLPLTLIQYWLSL